MEKLNKLAEMLASAKEKLLEKAAKDLKIHQALESQGRKVALPHEIHQELHAWWQANKDTALSPEQHKKLAEVKAVKERRAGMKVVKEEGDSECNECLEINKNGQWELGKSNYGPKGMGLYSPKDNIQRKMTRTGEEVDGVGQNKAVRQYTTSNSSMSQAASAAEEKRQAAANKKAPVKTLADMSDEEKKALEAKYGAKLKKGEDLEKSLGGWNYNKDTGNFNHATHGSVTVRAADGGKHAYEVVHNGKIISKHGADDRAGAIKSAGEHMKYLAASMQRG